MSFDELASPSAPHGRACGKHPFVNGGRFWEDLDKERGYGDDVDVRITSVSEPSWSDLEAKSGRGGGGRGSWD